MDRLRKISTFFLALPWRKLGLAAIAATAILAAVSLAFEGQAVTPQSSKYVFKSAGEWLRVNIFTFGAPEKQQLHLVYAGRRVGEMIASKGDLSPCVCGRLLRHYELELARAEFMAEQLTLLDPKFRYQIIEVYDATLNHLKLLSAAEIPPDKRDLFSSVSQQYNSFAIKRLLQKHQDNPEDSVLYRKLVEKRFDWAASESSGLSDAKREQLEQARKILSEGKELEWAYDILNGIR